MRVLNLSPFTLATKASSRRPPQPELTIIAVGTYRIDDSPDGMSVVDDFVGVAPPCGDLFEEDDRNFECLHASDFADFKLNGEVLVRATCHPPGGKAVTECPVRLRIGKREKLLRVVGEREWEDGALGRKPSAPQLFTEMPIRWRRAFGGSKIEANPVGCHKTQLPNVERPDAPMQSPSDRPAPAGFGPIHPDWPVRKQHLGTRYDKSWRDTRAPYFAEDFDHRYFSAAPPDQQIDGFFRGGEKLGFDNMHPERAIIDVVLPKRRVSAFFFDRTGAFHRTELILDTVHALLEESQLRLVWRGVSEVPVDDPMVVRSLVLVDLPRDTAPTSDEEAKAMLEAYEADPAGVEDALGEVRGVLALEPAELSEAERTGNPISDMLKARLGDGMPELQSKVRAAVEQAREKVPQQHRGRLEEELRAGAVRVATDTPPPARRIRPGAPPETRLRAQMRDVLSRAAAARVELAQLDDLDDERRAETLAAIEATEAVVHDPRLKQIDPDYTPPVEPLSSGPPGPGADLSERDFSDLDLSGLDLSGADLSGALLVRTNLRGAKLTGAKLHKAIAYRADLSGADLTEADLTKINAARALLCATKLTKCRLEEGFYEDADLTEADLSEATGDYVVFTRAKLKKAKLRQAKLVRADLSEADLADADLTRADLTRTYFGSARAEQAVFDRSVLTRAGFNGASLRRAHLVNAIARDSVWIAADLTEADLTGADLSGAEMSQCIAPRAKLVAALMRKTRLLRAVLDDADISGSDLFEAVLDRAQVSATRFVAANLYGASFLGALGRDADFEEAILTLSSLERG